MNKGQEMLTVKQCISWLAKQTAIHTAHQSQTHQYAFLELKRHDKNHNLNLLCFTNPLNVNSCLPLPAHPGQLLLAALLSPCHGDRHPKQELALSTQFLNNAVFFWQPADWELGLSSVSYGSSLVLL